MQPRTLKFKVVLYLSIALSAGMLLFTGLVAWFLYTEILGKVSDHVTQLSEVITKSTRFAMLQNQPTYVDRIIRDVADQEKIDRIRILNKDGRIIHSTYSPEIGEFVDRNAEACTTCHGTRYNAATLEIAWRDKNIAEVLDLTVDAACSFFVDETAVMRSLTALRDIGLGYLRLGQPATELSGGEAQRIKLATELQRAQHGNTLYILDEPTTGLHPADVDRLMVQLQGLADAGNTVVVVEHDMRVAAQSDWVIDVGPGAGDAGGTIVASGLPSDVAGQKDSRTAAYLRQQFAE